MKFEHWTFAEKYALKYSILKKYLTIIPWSGGE